MLRKDFQNTKPPVVVCLSGGLDSAVLLDMIVKQHGPSKVSAVSFDYGQRHERELVSAMDIAGSLRVKHKIINLPVGVFLGSSQTDERVEVPYGHYEDESMKVTVVPNRNSIFLNYAAAWAISTGGQTVAYAAHAGDHTIYPDCRPEFAEALAVLFERIHFTPLDLFTPFITVTKKDIASWAPSAAFVKMTYSCYEGRNLHCGRCGTCTERKEALGANDPTEYEE